MKMSTLLVQINPVLAEPPVVFYTSGPNVRRVFSELAPIGSDLPTEVFCAIPKERPGYGERYHYRALRVLGISQFHQLVRVEEPAFTGEDYLRQTDLKRVDRVRSDNRALLEDYEQHEKTSIGMILDGLSKEEREALQVINTALDALDDYSSEKKVMRLVRAEKQEPQLLRHIKRQNRAATPSKTDT